MKKRIAIGAAIALLASIAFATVASASDQFDDGIYSVDLPNELGTVDFTVTDGTIEVDVDGLPDGFTLVESDDTDSIKLTSDLYAVEIEADDDAEGGIDIDVESLAAANLQADDDSVSTGDTEDDESAEDATSDDSDSDDDVTTPTVADDNDSDEVEDSVSDDESDDDTPAATAEHDSEDDHSGDDHTSD